MNKDLNERNIIMVLQRLEEELIIQNQVCYHRETSQSCKAGGAEGIEKHLTRVRYPKTAVRLDRAF